MIRARRLCNAVVIGGVVAAASSALAPSSAQINFRPESERPVAKESAYEQWVASEGVPVYRGQAIPSLMDLKLGPWKRMGVRGAESLPVVDPEDGRLLGMLGRGDVLALYERAVAGAQAGGLEVVQG